LRRRITTSCKLTARDDVMQCFWSGLIASWYVMVCVPDGPLRLSLQNPGVPALGWTGKPYRVEELKMSRAPSAVQATEP
jgi:hypothetical protein